MIYLYICINKLIKNLNEVDWFSKNHLFISIKYGIQERRTNVKWNNNKPEWNESFIFEISEDKNENIVDEQKIICEIYDHNMWSPSQRLGVDIFNVNLEELKNKQGKYLDVTIGNLLFKKEVIVNLLTLKNTKLKKDIEKLNTSIKGLNDDNKKLYDENINNERDDHKIQDINNALENTIQNLQAEFINLKTEHNKLKKIYDETSRSYLHMIDENTNLLDEKEKLLKNNNIASKENIELNKENIKLFDKIVSVKNILN